MTEVELMAASKKHVVEAKKIMGDICRLIRTLKKTNPNSPEITQGLTSIDELERSRSNALKWIEHLKKKGIE